MWREDRQTGQGNPRLRPDRGFVYQFLARHTPRMDHQQIQPLIPYQQVGAVAQH